MDPHFLFHNTEERGWQLQQEQLQEEQLEQLEKKEQLPGLRVEYWAGEGLDHVGEENGCRTLSLSINVSPAQEKLLLGQQQQQLEQLQQLASSAAPQHQPSLEADLEAIKDSKAYKMVEKEWKIREAREDTWQEPDFSAKSKTFKITKVGLKVVFVFNLGAGFYNLNVRNGDIFLNI